MSSQLRLEKIGLKQIVVDHIAKILIDVQPMTAPVGQVFTLKVKYGFGYGHGKYGIYEDEEEVRTDFGSEFGNE